MPNWKQILDEINETGTPHDIVRRRYLEKLSKHTHRNAIAYYSGWLQKPDATQVIINDADKNGFMSVVNGLDRELGLDLLLHTPGGDIAATESIVDYLRSMFNGDIRAIVPQLAMSAGTMIACSCKEIMMGKQSSLGPIDPQYGGLPAHGVLEEIERAFREVKENPSSAVLWQPIINKYHPTMIGECEKAVEWSETLVKEWLTSGMFRNEANATQTIQNIITELGDHAVNLNHARHISLEKARSLGLKVIAMEDDHELQDLILSIHHAMIHTLSSSKAFKIIENHQGSAFIQQVHVVQTQR